MTSPNPWDKKIWVGNLFGQILFWSYKIGVILLFTADLNNNNTEFVCDGWWVTYAVVYRMGGNWWPNYGILKCFNFVVFMCFFNLYGLIQTLYGGILQKNIGFSFNKPWCTVGVAIGGQKMGF